MLKDPKEIIHYYVDGGIKNNIAVAALIRKGFGLKTIKSVRRYNKKITSSDIEMRAIWIAIEDAIANDFNLNNIIIHTDQIQLVKKNIKNKKSKKLIKFLDDSGIVLVYSESVHIKPSDNSPKKFMNSYRIHSLVSEELDKPNNRFRNHLNKKRRIRKTGV